MTVLGEPLGDLGESTVRNRPCGKWPVGKQISLESGVDLYILDERGLDFDGLGEPRGPNWTRGGLILTFSGSLGELRGASEDRRRRRRRLTWISPSPHPITPRKKYVVRPGSSLRQKGRSGGHNIKAAQGGGSA